MLYQKLRQRYITDETSSFTGTPPPAIVVPQSPLNCDFIDLLPRSVSSPASPAPDQLSLELAQRRQGVRNASRQRTTHQNVRKSSPRKAKLPIR